MKGGIIRLFAIMLKVKSDKSKPVEKRGRKAKGLKLWRAVKTARLPKMRNRTIFASLVKNQARFIGTLSFVRSIKANPLKNGDAKPRV